MVTRGSTKAPPPLKQEPLWVRVDRNRFKLAMFVATFVIGSAVLLTAAMVALPGSLLSWGASVFGYGDSARWFSALPWVIGLSLGGMLLVGGLLAAVQMSNAEDWVRSRFSARDAVDEEAVRLKSSLHDMSLAAGLPAPPALLVIPGETVNAFAIGTSRNKPVIGVTEGLLAALDEDEERAVVATLVARIIAGDIMFGTALAALMGPLKAVRSAHVTASEGCSQSGCADSPGCGNGCASSDGCGGGCLDVDSDDAGGLIIFLLFLAVVAALTYAAVVTAAWIVTVWGRVLHRTAYEKADAEGMLLLKDPGPMLSALGKSMTCSNELLGGDPSYDGILYAATSGTAKVTRVERRRFRRLAEVLGVDGVIAESRLSAEDSSS